MSQGKLRELSNQEKMKTVQDTNDTCLEMNL